MLSKRKMYQGFCALALTFSAGQMLAKDPDRMDLKKLEDEYWAGKDKDMAVVQNRTYTKANRPFLSLSYGTLVNDPNATGRMTDVSAGYYFNERYGVEVAYEKGALQDNDATNKYRTTYGSSVDHNFMKDYKLINFLFVPFYAKMSFMDSAIIYFDMQFALGVGSMNYEVQRSYGGDQQSTLGYNFDFTQQMFFSKNFALRLDLKNKWSKQNQVNMNSGADMGSTMKNDTSLLLGVTLFW